MSRWGRRALIAGAIAGITAACIDLGGPKTGVVAISSLRIPYPAVVLGDIMRDSLGIAAPLALTAFDEAGNPIAGETINFFALDSTISVDADGTVHGLQRDSLGARIVAGAGALQTPAQKIFVSVKPETATKSSATTAITFEFGVTDSVAATNRATLSLAVKGAALAGAQGFVVSYQLIRSPAPLPAGVPTAYIADDAAKASLRDTTDKDGNATRQVILRQAAVGDAAVLGGTKTDTIIVRATVKYLGLDVTGSPIDFIVPVRKK